MKITFTLIITLLSYCAFSQVIITDEKDNLVNIEDNAILELRSKTKGMLIPRLFNSDALTGKLVAGMIFFNLEKDCIQGWNGTEFIALTPCTEPKFQSLFSEDFQEYRGLGFKKY
ncbi:MAG: hypothetical protein ACR2MS_04900 [Weeksellaceae bacterium]